MEAQWTDQVARKEKFVADHPEWSIAYVRSAGYFEAVRDEPNTVITDYDLCALLDRVERATETRLPLSLKEPRT